jgi:hypothetical protein
MEIQAFEKLQIAKSWSGRTVRATLCVRTPSVGSRQTFFAVFQDNLDPVRMGKIHCIMGETAAPLYFPIQRAFGWSFPGKQPPIYTVSGLYLRTSKRDLSGDSIHCIVTYRYTQNFMELFLRA